MTHSSLVSLYLILAFRVLQLDPIAATGDGHDPTCVRLRDSPSNGKDSVTKFPIFAIGHTTERMLLITQDLLVYDLPQKAMENRNQLRIKDKKPVKLCTKWPFVCNENRSLENAEHKFTMGNNSFLALLTGNSNKDNIVLDIQNMRVYRGVHFMETDANNQPWISSSSDSYSPYQMTLSNGSMTLVKMIVKGIANDFTFLASEMDRSICSNDGSLLIKNGNCNQSIGEANVSWPVECGYVANDNFYLLGSDRVVHIFPEKSYHDGNLHKLTEVKFEKFFICADPPTSKGNATRTSVPMANYTHRKPGNSAAKTGLLVGIVILVVIAVVVCCFLILCKPGGPVQKTQNANKSNKQKVTKAPAEEYQYNLDNEEPENEEFEVDDGCVTGAASNASNVMPKTIKRKGMGKKSKSKSKSRSLPRGKKNQGGDSSAEVNADSESQPQMISRGTVGKQKRAVGTFPKNGRSTSRQIKQIHSMSKGSSKRTGQRQNSPSPSRKTFKRTKGQ